MCDLTPNTSKGGGPATIAVSCQGRPILTCGLTNIGALFKSSGEVPLKPTRVCPESSIGNHANSSPIVREPACRASGEASTGVRPLSNIDDAKYLSAHDSGRSKVSRPVSGPTAGPALLLLLAAPAPPPYCAAAFIATTLVIIASRATPFPHLDPFIRSPPRAHPSLSAPIEYRSPNGLRLLHVPRLRQSGPA